MPAHLGADPDTNVSKTSTVGAQPCLHRTKLPPATVLTVLTIATAWFGDGLIGRAQALRGQVGWASAVLLWLAGAYVVYYWLTAIRLF